MEVCSKCGNGLEEIPVSVNPVVYHLKCGICGLILKNITPIYMRDMSKAEKIVEKN